jgi:hypothetical protein
MFAILTLTLGGGSGLEGIQPGPQTDNLALQKPRLLRV